MAVELLEKIADTYKTNKQVKVDLGKYSNLKPLYNARTEPRSVEHCDSGCNYDGCDSSGCDVSCDSTCNTCDM
jgi:hypothetical protein